MDDPEFKRLIYLNDQFNINVNGMVFASDYIPILRLIMKKQIQ